MKRKLIALAAAAAMLCQFLVPVYAAEPVTVLNDDFSDGTTGGYEVYSSEKNPTLTVENSALKYECSDGWNESNGIKKDITSVLSDSGFESGDTLSVSLKMSSSWGNPDDGTLAHAKVFLEIGTDTIDLAADELSAPGWADAQISGSAAVNHDIGSNQVYFCVTQVNGTHIYDDISLTLTKSGQGGEGGTATTAPTVAPTDAPSAAPTGEPADDTVLNDTFDTNADAGYEVYDTAAEITYNGESMDVKPENGWEPKNGVKKDITSLVKSGVIYSASADITASYWGDTPGDGPAKLFFEVVSGTNKKQISIGEAIADGTVSGSAALTFNDGDKVYICITQPSGYYQIDNVKIKADAQATAAPTNDPSGGDSDLMEDTFSDGSVNGYAVYDDSDTAAQVMVGDGDRLIVNFGSSWSDNNGIKKDITEFVRSGSKYTVSADFESTYWGDKTAKMFFEIKTADGSTSKVSVCEVLGEGESGAAALSGTADLRFADGDTVYLCITQGAGTQYYDNITVKRVGDADPVATQDPSKTPEPTKEPVGDTIFTDDFSDNAQLDKYGLYVEYDDADAGVSVSGGVLKAAMGSSNSWTATNGIRRDITAEVSQYISGMTFGAHVELNAYWNQDATGKIFFETVSSNGIATVADIADFPIPDGIPSGGGNAVSVAEGSAQLNYKAGDTVYLCATQMSGNHDYDNISLWIEGSGGGDAITLTSGKKAGGEFFPDTANAIFSDGFAGSTAEDIAAKYTPCNDIQFSQDPGTNNGGALFQFPDGEGSVHGVAVDVTDAFDANLPNGGTVRVGCKMLPWWWWGSASVKLRIDGRTVNVVDYTSKTNDPSETWAVIRDVVDVERAPGEKTEILIMMNSGSATGFTIDDVCVELPYDTVMARDIAVKNAAELANIKTADIVYGGSFVTSTGVKWGAPSGNVVYGETDIEGVTARAYITDGNVKKVTVTPSGVTVSDYKLEAGKTAGASGGNEMVFLLDSMDTLNLMSAVSGTGDYASPQSGKSDKTAAMAVHDNGNGITVEGTIESSAYNDEVIIIKDSAGNPVAAEYVHIGADGTYSADSDKLATGEYTAAMTDTGVSVKFSYASDDDFEALRRKINAGQSVSELMKDNGNRVVLGAGTYSQYDRLSSDAQSAVGTAFAAQLGSKTRAEAAELFDALVAIKAASSSAVTESEWTQMLKASADELGIKDSAAYSQYKSLPSEQRASVKSKTASQNPSDADSFKKALGGAVINTRLMNAGNYTNVQSILKENADLFSQAGVNVSSISNDAAKYINSHISNSDITIDALAALVNAAVKNAAATDTGSAGSGGGGGGGGGRGSSSNGGVSGSNVGLSTSQGHNNPLYPDLTPPSASPQYSDLVGYEWAQNAIDSLSASGVLNGYGNGIFNPGGNVTREEFVKIIVTAFGIPSSSSTVGFNDVESGRWSYGVISSALAAGIIAGVSDTEFAPEDNITRQDAAVIIYRALSYKGAAPAAGTLSFADSGSIAGYAADAVSALSTAGIITGTGGGMFSPAELATRAQAAVMIYRVMNTLL